MFKNRGCYFPYASHLSAFLRSKHINDLITHRTKHHTKNEAMIAICHCTVKSVYKQPANKQRPVTGNFFLFFNLKELVIYAFIRNSGYKEHIFMDPMSSLYSADFTTVYRCNKAALQRS